MNSSLLPNDIQDIDGLELKEQVKVIKDYIEYMREQLQWFSSVTDKNEEGFVQSVTTYYGVSSSPSVPPSEWSTEPPEVEEGEYLWQYTKVTRSGTTTRSEPVCISASMASGEDAALIYIHSSNGTVFRPGNNGTTLTITVYYGSDAIRTLANLQTAFGSGAHLAWYKREYGSDSYVPVSSSKISDNGFTVTLTSDDVDTRATYNCRLMLSETITRSQSSVTITDIEDGYTATLSQDSVTWNGNDTNLGANKTVSFTISGFCGVDTAPFTIGTPDLSDPSHASASVSGGTVTLTVSSTATAGGTVTLPVTFTDGPTLHSTFAYFVLLKGAQGIQGDQGDQGIQGPAGTDGRTTYVHIKYSHIANPQTSADISDTPDDYIGICTNYTSSDPTDPAAYVPWTRFKGQDGPQGIPGATGEDGTTYYVHFAYATSDTGADFSLTPFEGATYIGVCTDTELDDPTTPASYTWSLTKGEKGDAGYNAATIFLYQRKSSVPNKQAGTLTYTFANKALTGTLDNGWSTSIPSGTNPLYVIIATASSNTATDTIVSADWSSPVVLAQDGGAGAGISSVTEVYFAKANTTAPSAPSSTVTTNDPTVYNAWNKALPTYSASYPYYFTCSEVLLSNGTRVWSTPVYAGALTTANQTAASANTTATAANTTANAANTTAAAAQSTANTANSTANTAKSTADATKAELDNLEIGGRNLVLNTGTMPASGTGSFRASGGTLTHIDLTDPPIAGITGGVRVTNSGSSAAQVGFAQDYRDNTFIAGEKYTEGYWIRASESFTSQIRVQPVWVSNSQTTGAKILDNITLTTSWQYVKGEGLVLGGTQATRYSCGYGYASNVPAGGYIEVCGLKVEKGNRATDWTPAPEDVDAAIESVEDTATEALNKHGFCSCTTAAGTAAKTASLTGFQLKTGSTVHVTFTNANSVANPTLNINGTGAKTIKWNNANVTAGTSPWAAGECVAFVYDGTNWVISGQSNITADNIVAGSIAADRIKANVISAVNNGTGTINADKVNAAGLTIGQSQVTGLTTALNGKEAAVTGTTATYDTDQVPYYVRQASGAIMGQESLDQIVGGSLGWNQLVGTAGTSTANGVTFTNNGNGSWTITGTRNATNTFKNISVASLTEKVILENHVYYISGCSSRVYIRLTGNGSNGLIAQTSVTTIRKATSIYGATGTWIRFQIADDVTTINETLTPQVIDLTATFGSTIADYIYQLESSSSGSGIAWLRKYINIDIYHAYDAGSIQSVQATVHVTTGKNLLDVTNETSGSNAHIREYNLPDLPLGTYTVSAKCVSTASTDCAALFIYKDGTNTASAMLTNGNWSSQTFNLTKPVKTFRIYSANGYSASQSNTVVVTFAQLEFGSTATAYEPYTAHTYPLGSDTLRGIPQLVSNKLAYDGDIKTPDGTKRRRYGTVNLGTLTWTAVTAGGYSTFRASAPSDSASGAALGGLTNIMCAKYQKADAYFTNDKTMWVNNTSYSGTKYIIIRDDAYASSTAAQFKTAMSGVYLVYPLATETTESSTAYQQVQMADPTGTEKFVTTSVVPVGHVTRYPTNLKAAIDTLPVDTTDAAKTATNYITNINSGGITITGNSASSKIEIANTVKVIRDSTHFTEMTASDFFVHAGSATYPAARLAQNGAYLSGDGTGLYLARVLKAAFLDDQTTYGGMLDLCNTSGGRQVAIYAGPDYGTQIFYNSSNKMLLRIGADTTGQGEVSIYKPGTTTYLAGKLGTIKVYSGSQLLVNDEPTLIFYDNGSQRSWYSLKRAYIHDGNHQGYVVYGNTGQHGITVDYLTSGRINFYVDTTSIGYATITSSDERMKTDIEPIEERYKRAAGSVELKNFRFDFNDPTRSGANLLKRFGAIAQDVIKALDDEGINYEENELVETLEDDNGEYYTINYVPFLIARLAADEDRIKELETALERRLA